MVGYWLERSSFWSHFDVSVLEHSVIVFLSRFSVHCQLLFMTERRFTCNNLFANFGTSNTEDAGSRVGIP